MLCTSDAPSTSRAARAGHVALIELFLAHGAAIDARNLAGASALYAAAESERQASVALLLAKGEALVGLGRVESACETTAAAARLARELGHSDGIDSVAFPCSITFTTCDDAP